MFIYIFILGYDYDVDLSSKVINGMMTLVLLINIKKKDD